MKNLQKSEIEQKMASALREELTPLENRRTGCMPIRKFAGRGWQGPTLANHDGMTAVSPKYLLRASRKGSYRK